MAQAILNHLAGESFEPYSAGIEPRTLNPFTVRVLEEKGIDTSGLYAKPLTTYIGKINFHYLITVCSNADERCPYFPGMGIRLHWPFEDPAAFQGTEEEKLARFRLIRDEIEARIREWLKEIQP
jgi:arsenate reductase